MANSAEVILRFTGDQRQLKQVLAAVRADLSKFGQVQVAANSQTEAAKVRTVQQSVSQISREEQKRLNDNIKSANQRLKEEQRTAREVARIMAETARQAAAQERVRERAAKQLADVRIREARRAAKEIEQSLQPAGQSRGLGAGALLAGAAGGIAALIGVSVVGEIRQAAAAWFEYSSKLEATRIAFTTMLGSAEAANTHLKELERFALSTPFEFQDLVAASQRMQALGFEASQVVPILNDVGNAVAAAGGGSERLDRVVLALSQIQSKGKVATQEMNQLAEAGIPGWKILEQQLGKSRAELAKLVEQGKISSAVFLEAFQTFSRNNFGDLMEKQSKTALGALSNLKDALLQISNEALKPLFDLAGSGLLGLSKSLGDNKSSWVAWGQEISNQVASSIRGLGSLLSTIRDANDELARLIGLDQLQARLREQENKPGSASEIERFAGIVGGIAGAIRNRNRSRLPNARGDDAGEFAVAGVVLDAEGRPVLPRTTAKPPLGSETTGGGGKSGSSAEAQREFQRLVKEAELTHQEALERLDELTVANKRELDRQIKDISQFTDDALLLLDKRAIASIEVLIQESRANQVALNRRLITIEEFNQKERAIDLKTRTILRKNSDDAYELESDRDKQISQAKIVASQRDLANAEAADNREIERIKDRIERGIVSEVAGEQKIKEILDQGFARRRKALEDEEKAYATSVERRREITDELKQLDEDRAFSAEQAAQRIIDARNREIAEITPQPFKEVQPRATFLSDKDIDSLGPAPSLSLRSLIGLAAEAQGVFGAFGTILSDTFNLGATGAQAFAESLSSAFEGVANAVGSAVHAFVLFGTVEGGFKKFAAEMIASLAAQASVQALYQAAQGLAWLALNFFFPNPKYAAAAATAFASAAAFGLIAGATIPLGRAISGNSFSSGGGGGSGSSTPATNIPGSSQTTRNGRPETVEIDRATRNQQSIVVNLTVTGQATEGFKYMVEEANVKSYRESGVMNNIVRHAMGEPGFQV